MCEHEWNVRALQLLRQRATMNVSLFKPFCLFIITQIFGHWSDMVTDLIKATHEEDVLRRDIYDRPPIFKWAEVCVCVCWGVSRLSVEAPAAT